MGNLLHSEGCLFLSNQSEPLPEPAVGDRRSSRIPLVIRIVVAGIHPETRLYFQAVGNTLVVNRHGALISTIPGLQSGMRLNVTVVTNGKSVRARVIWDSARSEGRYGIELETPENLWKILFPPADWGT